MDSGGTLPRWQLRSIYDGIDSEPYREARRGLAEGLISLEERVAQLPEPGRDMPVAAFEETLTQLNALRDRLDTLTAYLNGFVSTDAFDDHASSELSVLRPLASRLQLASTRFQAWIARLDREALVAASQPAREHTRFLERAAVVAEHLLPSAAEELAAALAPSGGAAWSRLHSAIISRHTISVQLPDRPPSEFGIAGLLNLQSDPDGRVREAAWRAELELLERNSEAFTAALNSIKGEVNELSRRRGWSDPLAMSLFANGIGAASLEAMHRACREAFPVLRRYLKAKARFLGADALGWHDLLAPVGSGEAAVYSWPEAERFVAAQFRDHWPPLAEFAERAFAEQWIDVAPRKGKRNGAFCMGVPERHESRILLNYGNTLDDVFTLAHELGHGYHNERRFRSERTSLQSATPMTLAETASIFCETVVTNAMLAQSDAGTRLAILEQDLLGTTQQVIDIHTRFLFEREVFERRRERELSTSELCDIMLDAQQTCYGDALRSDRRHPFMWAHKGHYYSSERSFYNYPYTFGLLFGLGLYAAYRRSPDDFELRYDALLADTGIADAATLAARFGIDIDDIDFWRSSLALASERVDEYERLVAAALEDPT